MKLTYREPRTLLSPISNANPAYVKKRAVKLASPKILECFVTLQTH